MKINNNENVTHYFSVSSDVLMMWGDVTGVQRLHSAPKCFSSRVILVLAEVFEMILSLFKTELRSWTFEHLKK